MVQRSDFSTDKFREIQGKIESSVQSLRPQEEYKEFIEKYKSVHTYFAFISTWDVHKPKHLFDI